MAKRVIETEDDALALIEEYLPSISDPALSVSFNRFIQTTPLISLEDIEFSDAAFTYYDTSGDSSVDIDSMRALKAVQSQVYRTYAFAKTGEANANRLTDDERQKLKLKFRVSPGSSDIEAKLGDAAVKVLLQLGDKIDPVHAIVLAAFIFLLWFGRSVYSLKLAHDAKVQEIAAKSEERREVFSELRYAYDVGERLETTIQQVQARIPEARVAAQITSETTHEVLRSISNDNVVRINGLEVSGANAKAATRRPRTDTDEQFILGEFDVITVDSSPATSFKVRLRNVHNGEIIIAGITDALVQADQRDAIAVAEWKRSPLRIRMRVLVRAQKIIEASIIDAEVINE